MTTVSITTPITAPGPATPGGGLVYLGAGGYLNFTDPDVAEELAAACITAANNLRAHDGGAS